MNTLTQEDWIEIYYALDTKANMIERGEYVDEDPVDTWGPHLRTIMEKIGPDGKNMIHPSAPKIDFKAERFLVRAVRLLEAVIIALNTIPNTRLFFVDNHRDTYSIAANIDKLLLEIRSGEGRKEPWWEKYQQEAKP